VLHDLIFPRRTSAAERCTGSAFPGVLIGLVRPLLVADHKHSARPVLGQPSRVGISQEAICNIRGYLNMKTLTVAAAALAVVNASARAESGIASLYSTRELGTKTASGRALHDGALTAAHKTLPFGSRVRVTNRANGRSVVVTVTDRGPYARGRVIDLTPAGARVLGFSGLAPVTLERAN
jgi:rare lipoprotein A